MVELWNRDGGTVEHLMVEQLNGCGATGEHMMVERRKNHGGTVDQRSWNSGTGRVEP